MLRVERVHYSLAVTCTFGDLYYVLQNMGAFHLVAEAPDGVDSYEHYRRPEFTARVLTGGGACVADASIFDQQMTREIRYRALSPLRTLFKTQPWR